MFTIFFTLIYIFNFIKACPLIETNLEFDVRFYIFFLIYPSRHNLLKALTVWKLENCFKFLFYFFWQ